MGGRETSGAQGIPSFCSAGLLWLVRPGCGAPLFSRRHEKSLDLTLCPPSRFIVLPVAIPPPPVPRLELITSPASLHLSSNIDSPQTYALPRKYGIPPCLS